MKRCCLTFVVLLGSSFVFAQGNSFRLTNSEYSSLLSKAKNGNAASQVKLGLAFQYGLGVQPDYSSAEYWLKTAAGFGDPEAESQLGLLYLQPELRESHAKQAMQWFMRAAASGYAPAEHNLGMMYMRGVGAQASDVEAIRWFRKAAQHGSIRAEVYAGMLLVQSPDPAQRNDGFGLVKQAAKSGSPEAMNALGYCYDMALGTTMDLKEAVNWYKRAADKGDVDGMHNLAALYNAGRGVSKDRNEGFRWNQKACDAGDSRSCLALASNYLTGDGATKDLNLAYRYALIGHADKNVMTYIETRISEEAKANAAAEAERWRTANAVRLSTLPQ